MMWDAQHEMEKKTWEIEKLGMMTDNAQVLSLLTMLLTA
jgi:hypothetical protein